MKITLFIYISARIIVTTGVPNYLGKKSEVIDLENPEMEYEFLTDVSPRSASVGGLLQFITSNQGKIWYL